MRLVLSLLAFILAATGVHVPPVIAVDAEQGFVLMGDLGRQHYLESLGHGADPEPLYADALDALVLMQSGEATAAEELPSSRRRSTGFATRPSRSRSCSCIATIIRAISSCAPRATRASWISRTRCGGPSPTISCRC